MNYVLKEISKEQIKEAWDKLWPGRDHYYVSDMTYPEKGYDPSIFEKYKPTFWGLYDGDRLIATNSGHKTSETYYRGRGVWVDEDYRRQKLAQIMWKAVADQGKREGCEWLWCLPRQPTFDHVIEFGFERVSDWMPFKFGINAYALYNLTNHNIQKPSPAGSFYAHEKGRTICEVHRELYDVIYDHFYNHEQFTNFENLLQEAYDMAKSMDRKLRQYKNNYDDGWYEKEKLEDVEAKISKRKKRNLEKK